MPRKTPPRVGDRPADALASMRPRPDAAENAGATPRMIVFGATLQ